MSAWDDYVNTYNNLLVVADNTEEDDKSGMREAQALRDELHEIAVEADGRVKEFNPPQDVDIQEVTWGVEMETVAPISNSNEHGLRIGPHGNGYPVPYLPHGWTAERDGSIRYDSGFIDCEIVSPKAEFGYMHGADGIRQIIAACATLQDYGHKVNNSCGVHVTLGWKNTHPLTALDRLITVVAYLETGLYASTGTKRRETSSWCKSVRQYDEARRARDRISCDRYHGLNLTNRGAVEFRFFSESIEAVKVCTWTQVCMGLVQRALGSARKPEWKPAAPKGGWAKKGPGQTEIERLLSYIAWPEGQSKAIGGYHWGILSDEIPIPKMMTELRRLAAKYDGEGRPGE